MAEFKFFCPVCGQRILGDTGYSGKQINCPVCLKQIVVPQAPTPPARHQYPVTPVAQPAILVQSNIGKNALIVLASVLVLALLGFVGWLGSTKNGTSEFLKEGLVAYYPLNGNANDGSGNKHDGHIVGAVPGNDRFGNPDSALNFNGKDSYISFESVPLNKLDDWTLCAWIKPASIDQDSIAICLGSDDGNYGNGFELGFSGGNKDGNHLYGILGSVTWIDSGYAFPTPNTWYHIVMLRTGGITKFFVNGNQTANTESSPQKPFAVLILIKELPQSDINAGLLVGIMSGCGGDVRVAEKLRRSVDPLLCGDDRPNFLSEFVKWFVRPDAFAAQPSVEPVEGVRSTIVGAQCIGFRCVRALENELRPRLRLQLRWPLECA